MEAAAQPVKDPAVTLDLYVMSQCPFGVQAENVIVPAVKSLGTLVDLNLHFIANAQPGADAGGKPTFTSLHGQSEVDENIRQVCAEKHFPDRYLEYLLERNKSYRDPGWQGAAKAARLDPAVIERCAAGPEGAALLAKNLQAQPRKATASPTIDINGAPYTGPRGLRSLTLAMCEALKAKGVTLPDACKQAEALPPDPVPTAGGGCGGGGAQAGGCGGGCGGGAAQPTQAAPSQVAPARAAQPAVDTARIPVQLTRKRAPRHLDLFVSPLAPATAALEADLIRILSALTEKDVTVSFHMLVQEGVKESAVDPALLRKGGVWAAPLTELRMTTPGPLLSAGGEAELQESLRQTCLFRHVSLGDFFKYLTCRNQDLADPKRVETCLVMGDVLRRCVEGGEGERILREDARLARDLGLQGGPVLLWENRYGPFRSHELDAVEQLINAHVE